MDIPARETLLDIDWLVRRHAAEGPEQLARCLRAGAEVYGGPVTAVADALRSRRSALPWRADTDFQHALAIQLLAGSWSPDPDGPRKYHTPVPVLISTWPSAKRAELLQKYGGADLDPLVPDLNQLRLIEPLDRAWIGHTDGIWGCDVSPDARYVVSASRDGDVSLWDMEFGTLVARANTGEREIRDCAITPDGRRVISMHATGRFTVWDLPTMAAVATFDGPQCPADVQRAVLDEPKVRASPLRWRRFAVSPDSRCLAVAGWGAVDIWDLERLRRITTLEIEPTLPRTILALFFVSDTKLTTVGRNPHPPVLTWDVAKQRVTASSTLTMPEAATVETALATTSGHIVAASGNETTVWQVDDPTPFATAPFGVAGRGLAVSADGRFAATTSDWEVRLWSLPNLAEVHRWHLHDLGLWDISCALAFVPDSRYLIVAGWEGVLRRVVLPSL